MGKNDVIFEGPRTNFRNKHKKAMAESRKKMGNLPKSVQKSDARQRKAHKKMFGHYPKSW